MVENLLVSVNNRQENETIGSLTAERCGSAAQHSTLGVEDSRGYLVLGRR